MKLIFWIVGVPLVLLAGLFAIANRDEVAISLFPLGEPLSVPLFVAIIVPLYVGVVIGAFAAWWSARPTRKRARAETRRANELARENDALKAKLAVVAPASPTSPTPDAATLADQRRIDALLPPTLLP